MKNKIGNRNTSSEQENLEVLNRNSSIRGDIGDVGGPGVAPEHAH